MAVEHLGELRVHMVGVHLPPGQVVAGLRLGPARPGWRCVVRRRQVDRRVTRVHVTDARGLGHGPRGDLRQAGHHQRVTSLDRRGKDVELCVDQLGPIPRQFRRRGQSRPAHHVPHGRPDRKRSHTDTCQPPRELLVRRGAHPYLHAEPPATAPRGPPAVRHRRASRMWTTTPASCALFRSASPRASAHACPRAPMATRVSRGTGRRLRLGPRGHALSRGTGPMATVIVGVLFKPTAHRRP